MNNTVLTEQIHVNRQMKMFNDFIDNKSWENIIPTMQWKQKDFKPLIHILLCVLTKKKADEVKLPAMMSVLK